MDLKNKIIIDIDFDKKQTKRIDHDDRIDIIELLQILSSCQITILSTMKKKSDNNKIVKPTEKESKIIQGVK